MFYRMILSADEVAHANIEMTKDEAKTINRTLTELSLSCRDVNWCGSCSIDVDSPSLTKYPKKALCICKDCNTEWELDDPDNDKWVYCPNNECKGKNYKSKIIE